MTDTRKEELARQRERAREEADKARREEKAIEKERAEAETRQAELLAAATSSPGSLEFRLNQKQTEILEKNIHNPSLALKSLNTLKVDMLQVMGELMRRTNAFDMHDYHMNAYDRETGIDKQTNTIHPMFTCQQSKEVIMSFTPKLEEIISQKEREAEAKAAKDASDKVISDKKEHKYDFVSKRLDQLFNLIDDYNKKETKGEKGEKGLFSLFGGKKIEKDPTPIKQLFDTINNLVEKDKDGNIKKAFMQALEKNPLSAERTKTLKDLECNLQHWNQAPTSDQRPGPGKK